MFKFMLFKVYFVPEMNQNKINWSLLMLHMYLNNIFLLTQISWMIYYDITQLK